MKTSDLVELLKKFDPGTELEDVTLEVVTDTSRAPYSKEYVQTFFLKLRPREVK